MKTFWMLAGAAALALSGTAAAHDHKDKPGKGADKAMKAHAKAEKRHDKARGKADKQAEKAAKQWRKADREAAKEIRKAEKDWRKAERDLAKSERKARKEFTKDARAYERGMRDGFVSAAPIMFNGRARFDCPPGLDKKNNGCLPPGQAKKLIGAPLAAAYVDDRLPAIYRGWYRDDDDYYYRAGDGFILRIDRDRDIVDGLIPLFGSGYYTVGDPWPDPYDFYNVPYQYRSYWADGDGYGYRYGDGAIYRVDARSGLVESIVALLAADLGVGSRLPPAYSVYNVPISYRDRYYDTADDWYRYNDGYIYRVDPTTMLITAVIDAII